ncbi:large conductance mechanosensitive channel protein MscL [Phycicoccus jejuensis]|uniref:large conductance mechanosensitive channel protein MscL n=1 Tax=Phycicoccus TaxID=367298 RepID=UPI001A8C1D00|nr:large conductance mechanosensitive channel protein MscL [Phycicoccus sp. DTK01]GIL37218.1 large-conductance mechanosensitive channel [Phycicoccus sp. DTK01]
MTGFKNFLLRGNLVELAVAFIIGTAFAAVVKAFTDIVVELIGKVTGGAEFKFDDWQPGGWTTVGPFVTATVAFVLMAAVVYFLVVKPYERAKERFFPKEPEAETIDPNTELLKEIRDELRAGRGIGG